MKRFSLASVRSLAARVIGVALLSVSALGVQAQPISAEDSAFYLAINIDAIWNGQSSAPLYAYIDDNILQELREEFGSDAADQIAGISIFGSGESQTPVILLHGDIPQPARDRFVDSLFKGMEDVELLTRHGRNYFAFGDVQLDWNGHDGEDRNDSLLLAFGDRGQTMI